MHPKGLMVVLLRHGTWLVKNSWVGFQFYNRYLKKSGEVIGNSSFPFFVCYSLKKKTIQNKNHTPVKNRFCRVHTYNLLSLQTCVQTAFCIYLLLKRKYCIKWKAWRLLLEVYMLLLSFAQWIKLVCIPLRMLLIVSVIRHRILF